MDDLMNEDWQSQPQTANVPVLKPTSITNNPSTFAANLTNLRSSPALHSRSGNASPLNLSRPSSTINSTQRPSAASPQVSGGDAFGNLLGAKSKASASSQVSIQERQRQLVEERKRQQDQQAKLWDNLGSASGRTTPAHVRPREDEDDDILAAFNKAAPVDRSSHFPPPSSGVPSGVVSGRSTPALAQGSGNEHGGFYDDDDDPFGLSQMSSNGRPTIPAPTAAPEDEDDFLGDLGKPIAENPIKPEGISESRQQSSRPTALAIKEERAISELVDMGFPTESAKIALSETNGDVQAAVGWLLEQAHAQSKQQASEQSQSRSRRKSPSAASRSPQRVTGGQDDAPAWMRDAHRRIAAGDRVDSRSPVGAEKDATQMAQDLGSKFLKGANSLWKASQKQMAKTMREFQEGAESDPSQPKWLREASADSSRAHSQRRQPDDPVVPRQRQGPLDLTNEAAMLDAPRPDSLTQRPASKLSTAQETSQPPSRGRSPFEPQVQRSSPQPHFVQEVNRQPRAPSQRLNRQFLEEENAQAYISPARRRKATPKPEPQHEQEVDLFSPAPVRVPVVNGASSAAAAAGAVRPSPAIKPRPQAPQRSVPSVSPASLSKSAQHRQAGSEAFKRGDYAAAHESYTAAIAPLPSAHPVLIIVLTNRALTGIRTGDAKTAVSDADQALQIIGPSRGIGETIQLGGGEGAKDMKDFYGKALTRKAEALEHMEKWTDAAAVWRQCVESGVGGANAIQARNRCEQAANPAPKPTTLRQRDPPAARKAQPSRALGRNLQQPAPTSAESADAVKRLREANAAAEKADDEKFALTDAVDAKLVAWKGGKADNLRALLQSMDAVLWPEAGWKKVGMSDLVMPNKVKIVYMKAIGKVHPDKIPQSATTEQRMISAAVFATLNEAWDKFKKDNNL